MAGNGVIGALLVSLGIDSAAFTTGANEVEAKAGKLSNVLGALGGVAIAGVVAAAATAGTAFVNFGLASLAVADDVGDAAARLGISAVAFQKLGIAATAAGGTPQLMTEAMDKLNENMGDFIQTGGGKAAAAFKTLGLAGQITSGQISTADQAFYAVAKAMEGIQDPALKARIATQLFGKAAGVDMLEVLAAGEQALKGWGDAGAKAGRVMSEEMVKKLSAANQTLHETKIAAGEMATVMAGEAVVAIVDMAKQLSPLWEQAKALWSQVAAYLMPSIQDLGKAMVNFAHGPAGQWLLEVMREIGQVLGTVVVAGVKATVVAFTWLFKVVDSVGQFMVGVVDKMTKGFEWLRKVTHGLINIILPVAPAYKAMAASVDTSAKSVGDSVEKGFNRGGNAIAAVVTKTEKVKAAFEALKASLGSVFSGLATADETAEKEFLARMKVLDEGRAKDLLSEKDYIEQVRRAREALNDSSGIKFKTPELGKIEDRDIDTSGNDAASNYVKGVVQGMADIRERNRQMFAETFSDGIRAALSGDLGGFVSNWWQKVVTKNLDELGGKLFDLFGKIAGSMGSGSGGGLLKGIGSIFSTMFSSSPAFANGGTVGIKGGGGTDSRLFSAWVSPDEIINIGKAEDMSGGTLALSIEPSPWFDVRARDAAAPMARNFARQAAVSGAQGGAALARTQTAKRERSWMP